MTGKRRKRHGAEEIVRKLRDADAMLNAGKEAAAALQFFEISEATYLRWRNQYGGMKSEEAKRSKLLEEENKRLKELVAELTLDNRMLKHVAEKNGEPFAEAPAPQTFNRSSRSPSGGRVRRWSSREHAALRAEATGR